MLVMGRRLQQAAVLDYVQQTLPDGTYALLYNITMASIQRVLDYFRLLRAL